jgi:hypothetical protein
VPLHLDVGVHLDVHVVEESGKEAKIIERIDYPAKGVRTKGKSGCSTAVASREGR